MTGTILKVTITANYVQPIRYPDTAHASVGGAAGVLARRTGETPVPPLPSAVLSL